MNYIKLFLLTMLVALISTVSALAYDFEVDGIYYNTLSLQDLTCEVTSDDFDCTNKYHGDIIIPSKVSFSGKTFSVTTIGKSAFYGCHDLISVEIPNTICLIKESAFDGCSNLSSLNIPNSVTMIEERAFQSCSNLTYLNITDIAAWCKTIFRDVFSNPLYYANVLYLNGEIVSDIEIPNSVNSIGNYVLRNCSNLKNVIIPNSVTSIGEEAFCGCTNLESVVIPNSVTTIGMYAFNSCYKLSSVALPNSLTDIVYGAFSYCTKLTSVIVPNSVTNIGGSAFFGCSGLTSVVIGISSTYIGNQAFNNCINLAEITSLNTTPPNVFSETFDGVSKTECVVKVPEEAVDAYKSANVWKTFWNIEGLNGGGGETPETKVCVAPTIEFIDGKIIATTTTEGATCYTSITTEDYKGHDGNGAIELTGIYNVSSYAHAPGYQNSETVTKQFNMFDLSQGSVIEVHDTVYVDNYIEIEVPVIEYVEVHDTTYIDKYIEVPVEVHDTIYIYDDSHADLTLVDGTVCVLRVVNGIIYIDNAPLYEDIIVTAVDGKMDAVVSVEDYTTAIELPRNHIYIITVGGTQFKIKI